jgi:hypothetical protein
LAENSSYRALIRTYHLVHHYAISAKTHNMKKRGQLVALIAIAIAAVVLLVIVWPKLAVLLKGAGSTSTCNLNLLLSSAVKAGSLGFAEIPPGCEANYMTIGKQEIDARKNIAKKRLDKYYQDNTGYYADARTVFNVKS